MSALPREGTGGPAPAVCPSLPEASVNQERQCWGVPTLRPTPSGHPPAGHQPSERQRPGEMAGRPIRPLLAHGLGSPECEQKIPPALWTRSPAGAERASLRAHRAWAAPHPELSSPPVSSLPRGVGPADRTPL